MIFTPTLTDWLFMGAFGVLDLFLIGLCIWSCDRDFRSDR